MICRLVVCRELGCCRGRMRPEDSGTPRTCPLVGGIRTRLHAPPGAVPLTSYTKSQREAFNAGWATVLHLQNQWLELTVPDLIWELRRGTDSVFWPIIHTIDPGENPQINVNCPSDLVHPTGSLQPVTRDGYCLTCGFGHIDNAYAIHGDN